MRKDCSWHFTFTAYGGSRVSYASVTFQLAKTSVTGPGESLSSWSGDSSPCSMRAASCNK